MVRRQSIQSTNEETVSEDGVTSPSRIAHNTYVSRLCAARCRSAKWNDDRELFLFPLLEKVSRADAICATALGASVYNSVTSSGGFNRLHKMRISQ
jgi:hypothetical protein